MRRWPLLAALAVTSCVYFNEMYDTRQFYDQAVERRREGREVEARAAYDSVIQKAGRLVRDHPESSHAAPAALLKARAEIARRQWEAAAATAALADRLSTDPSVTAVAVGLEGVARRNLGEYEAADRLLSQALEADPSDEDRVLFLFHRGLTRLELDRAREAATDLDAVSAEERLSRDVRLDLARGLQDAEQYDASVALTDALLREDRLAAYEQGMDAHLDSLVRRAPAAVDSVFGVQLQEAGLTPTKRALLHYYRGLAREVSGDAAAALASYDSARVGGEGGRYGAEASYREGRLRIRTAERPADIVAAREDLAQATNIADPQITVDLGRLRTHAAEFESLVGAAETRGSTAAEAALRAAEIAGAELGARRVARGLYLRYLELAPDSPWEAKAIAGALLYADAPAGPWAGDEGDRTDARLEARLAGLPTSNPYGASLRELGRDANADSAYVEAERELERRLVQIRMLYDTTAAFVAPTDTAGALPVDEPEDAPGEVAEP